MAAKLLGLFFALLFLYSTFHAFPEVSSTADSTEGERVYFLWETAFSMALSLSLCPGIIIIPCQAGGELLLLMKPGRETASQREGATFY